MLLGLRGARVSNKLVEEEVLSIFERTDTHEIRCKRFLEEILVLGQQTCSSIAELVSDATNGKVGLTVNSYTSREISLALLGSILGALEANWFVISAERAETISSICKQLLPRLVSAPDPRAEEATTILNRYLEAFRNAKSRARNPLGEVTGIALVHCMGDDVLHLCVRNTTCLSPITHQIVMDMFLLSMTDAMSIWKNP